MKHYRRSISFIIAAVLMLQLGMPDWTGLSGQVEAATTTPVIVGTYPANGATNVPGNANLKITFDEPVIKGSSSAYIHVRRVDTNEEINTIAASSSYVSLNATGYVATIGLPTNLTAGLAYYVRIDQGAFVNVSNGANFDGLSDATAWRFEVGAADTTAPYATVYSPALSATNVVPTTPLTITFNEPVYASTGYITITRTGGDTQSIDVGSASVTGSGTSIITVIPDLRLQSSSDYSVSVPAGAFKDSAGNNYAGISNWNFSTAKPPMTVKYTPSNYAMGINTTDDLVMTVTNFSSLTKGSGNITIKRIGDNSQFQQIDVNSSAVSINQNVITIRHSSFESNKSYYVLVDAGAFLSGSTVYQGINNASEWTFSTTSGVDTTAPKVTALTPVTNGAVSVASASLVMTFDEPVYPSGGSIVIKNSSTNAVFQTIMLTSSNVKGGGTNTITIDHNPFITNTSYYVEIGSQAFRDLAGNYYVGMTASTDWSFRVTTDSVPPVIASLAPVNGADNVPIDSKLSITFNESIQLLKSTGSAVIRRSGSTTGAINATLSLDSTDSKKLILTPQSSMTASATYYVELAEGAIADLAGNRFAGIQNEVQWKFGTVGSDRTAPIFSNAVMSGSSTIVLTYNENLDTTSVPSTGNYYVTVNDEPRGVIQVQVSGNTVTLTLASGVIYGQTVRLTYSKGTRPIQDLSANTASSMSNVNVTNTINTTLPKPISGSVSGNVIMLTFNQELATLNSYAYTQFNVKFNGYSVSIAGIEKAGAVLLIRLGSTISSDSAVSVSYTQGSYPVYDNNGNALQTFGDFYVTNSLDTTAPVLQSISASGSTLILTYNEGLNTSYLPGKSSYSVLGNGISRTINAVEISNNQVILTLTSSLAGIGNILVTYVPSTSALRDLNGNLASGFSGIQAVSTGNSSVASAIVNGTTLTLQFNQTLHSSYVPKTNQFTVRTAGLTTPVANVQVSGSSVTLTLYTAIVANNTVTVSYSSDSGGLRNTSGVLVSSFSDINVFNQTSSGSTGGGSGGGGGGTFDATPDGAIVLQPGHYTTGSSMSPGSQLANQYTVLEESLNNAYKAARSISTSNPRVQLNIGDSEKAGLASIPLQALENAKNSGGTPTFIVKYGDITYEIPCNALDYAQIAKTLNVGGTTGYLQVKIDKNAPSLSYTLTSAINRAGAITYVSPVRFELDVTAGGVVKEWTDLTQYVTRSFTTTAAVTGRQAAVVWVDPATNVLSYLPTKVTTEGNSYKVSFMSKGNNSYAVVKGNVTYSDTSSHWANTNIMLMANKYIVEGRSTSKFEPSKPITRGEFAMFIARGLGLSGDKNAAAAFSDLKTNTALAAYVGAASKAGIVQGNSDGTFKPNNFITRQEAAAMLNRAASVAGSNVTLPQTATAYLQRFKDKKQIGQWAQQDVAKSVYTGFITGTTSTTFAPLSNTTRAEATIMIQRLLTYVGFLQS
ncbi:Ig-like domain-containing protein [Paenibacillus sp. PR3]|uniref:Ig-like domain-containing protein n=1 Tax=Paenibacillus terricola TaxID=2763503 RepID=A0ABR8MXY9_9BACL|nr:Ig-like domain-containing protein [Paenibacillus terricola]MBD3920810.1 Ig-like domain-containing protein [Paenibacillus terricola]